jgi:hypothetical protein
MKKLLFLAKYQTLAIEFLRSCENKRAHGDPQLLIEAKELSDGQLVRKWMWIASVVGGPLCFIVIPFTLCLLSGFMWPPLMQFLWNITRVAMGLVFMIFLLAMYFTTRHSG